MDHSTALIFLLTVLGIVFYYLQKQHEEDNGEQKNSSVSSSSDQQSLHEKQHVKKKDSSTSASSDKLCRKFSLAEIKLATNDFDDAFVIGKGGFGKVYKGKIDFGEEGIDVAIKRLNLDSNQGVTEFKAEIEMLSKFRHSHIVSLLGYHEGSDKREMIIVYEYMPNGSLEDHLHKRKVNGSNSSLLTWVQRLQICIGAARGLNYLHSGTGVKSRAIHRDIKSSNILLDENLAAKVSDFGLSRIGPANLVGTTNVYTDHQIKGTFGYMDAEYFSTRRLTRKSDVYAFGVVLLEVLCGRPALDFTLDEQQHSLAVWAKSCIKEGKIDQIIDPCLKGQTTPNCLQEFGQIAYECVLARSKDRPTMTKVLARLESVLALALQKHGGVTIAEKMWSIFSIKTPAVHAKNYRNRRKWSNDKKSKTVIPDKTATTVAEGSSEGKDNSIILVDPTQAAAEGNNDNIMEEPIVTAEEESSDCITTTTVECQGVAIKSIAQPLSCQMGTHKLKIFTFDELRRATRNFLPSAMLGITDGESIYKGWMDRDSYTPSVAGVRIAVTIKIIKKDIQRLKEGQGRSGISMFSHPNLVKLLGYCSEGGMLFLVHEYIPKRNFLDIIRQGEKRLTWETRIKIATGAAQGLAFLHTTKNNVIFRDLKSSNILLDWEFNAKLSDLGLAKLGPVNGESHVSTRVIGTYGYAAPEYIATGHLYVKSEVYNFGVVMLEIITGLRVLDVNRPYSQHNLVDWATPFLRSIKKLRKIMDPRLEQVYPSKGAMKVAELILNCLEEEPIHRPSMEEVVARLEKINTIKI
ncbi:hypothetical protein Lser_V15G36627 [Lactuca serriola]